MNGSFGACRRADNVFDGDVFQEEYLAWSGLRDVQTVAAGIQRLIGPESAVLDLGCGDGSLAVSVAPHAAFVIGFDLSPGMIMRARRRAREAGVGNAHFFVGDISLPAFQPGTFDLIASSFALHETRLEKTLPQLGELLRPGGILFFQEPCTPEWRHFRSLWFRWHSLTEAPEMVRHCGVRTAWRIFRFQQSKAWIAHQLGEKHWPLSLWQQTLPGILPGVVIDARTPGIVTALWKRPADRSGLHHAREESRNDQGTAPASRAATRVLRDYPGPPPVDHVPFPKDVVEGSVAARFEEVAELHARRPALRTPFRQWSYGELNADANRIAHAVLALGGGGPIAVLMDQDDPAIPALLGVLKSGRPYVFLDPGDAPGRWEAILAATGANLLVTTARRMAGLAGLRAAGCAFLTYEESEGNTSSGNPDLDIGPDHPAAIFFTSGSTGQPKGVVRDHRQFLHSTWLNTNTYHVSPSDRQSLLYFPGFTASVPNIYDTLLNGATLCSINPRRMSPQEVASWVRSEGLTHFNPPVGLWRNFLECLPQGSRWPDLRLVTLAGQALYASDVRVFQERFAAGPVLLCVLAMTEAGAVTQGYIDHTVEALEGAIPAGYPLPDKEVSILDAQGKALGPDREGRIAITSAYLSRGYWQDDERTRDSFLPVAGAPRHRMFRTGDRGLIRADGCLEYFGRDDSVVKVRGYRVDAGAVEAVLNSHESVLNAAVVVGEWRGKEPALAAYIVPRADTGLTRASLRAFLAGKVPAYMVPDYLTLLEAFPLTPSGKIDRRGLPAPGRTRPPLDTPLVAPRNELESQLAGIWREVLELDAIGVDDDFFELGGDSLLAMRMALAVEEALQISVSGDIFRHATVADLARAVSGTMSSVDPDTDDADNGVIGISKCSAMKAALRGLQRHVSEGPVLGGFGLPYDVGVRLQRIMVARLPIRRRFADRLALVRLWADELGVGSDWASLETVGMLSNTWGVWRARAMENPDVLGKWLKISDPHGYLSSGNAPGGLVLAVPHAGRMGSVLLRLFEQNGRETAIVANDPSLGRNDGSREWHDRQSRSRSEMVWHAREVLQRGGVVYIAPDGLKGQQAVEIPFWGRSRPFQVGAAELAVTTGASLVPAFVRFDTEGRVWVDIAPAPAARGETVDDRVTDLTRRYGEEYAVRWPRFFASMAWNHLQYNFNLPKG